MCALGWIVIVYFEGVHSTIYVGYSRIRFFIINNIPIGLISIDIFFIHLGIVQFVVGSNRLTKNRSLLNFVNWIMAYEGISIYILSAFWITIGNYNYMFLLPTYLWKYLSLQHTLRPCLWYTYPNSSLIRFGDILVSFPILSQIEMHDLLEIF